MTSAATTRWPALFTPHRLGPLTLPNRLVMAPMTRSRTAWPGDVPTELNARYYAQRAGAGLIVTEATQISREGQGYARTPGIHTAAQRDGWRLVTEAVHAAGGRIFLQLWHVGRVSHPVLQEGGRAPVAPSAVRARGVRVYVIDPADGTPCFLDCETPRALEEGEIPRVVDDYRRAAARAMEAGFDGVELHGANGYLIDQFLRSTTNRRTDRYGGSPENRIRFLREVVGAVAGETGAGRVGVRLSPHVTLQDMADPEMVETSLLAAAALHDAGVAYLHLAEADWDDAPEVPEDYRRALRDRFPGTIIVAGRYTPERGTAMLAAGHADLVTFGRPFLANPDLPRRIAEGLPLNPPDPATFFGGGAAGYIDYPAYGETAPVTA
ncbi:alkene reductase [Azospirillum halopraeferens]|uniref:alkene reductase n=1 Tax=Azospirillum halopraeferens TaxID=34010 RepID=UPI000419DEEE|nr:alkene reductase [Azospirillum halopraeferens]